MNIAMMDKSKITIKVDTIAHIVQITKPDPQIIRHPLSSSPSSS
jgi:hypothetical protein